MVPLDAEMRVTLEHDPEKWKPVFGKDHAQTNMPDHDPITLIDHDLN
jgi:hypothetical protein